MSFVIAVQGGLLGNFLSTGGACPLRGEGASKSRGGAENFDEFCKNVMEKFIRIE